MLCKNPTRTIYLKGASDARFASLGACLLQLLLHLRYERHGDRGRVQILP